MGGTSEAGVTGHTVGVEAQDKETPAVAHVTNLPQKPCNTSSLRANSCLHILPSVLSALETTTKVACTLFAVPAVTTADSAGISSPDFLSVDVAGHHVCLKPPANTEACESYLRH